MTRYDRILWRLVWLLLLVGTMLLLAAPYISGRAFAQPMSPADLQRQIDRLVRDQDTLERDFLEHEHQNAKLAVDTFSKLAALEREGEINRTGGVVAILGNALGWWLAFARMGRIQKFNGGAAS